MPSKPSKPRKINNNYHALATYFDCFEVDRLAGLLDEHHLLEKAQRALWRHVAARGTAQDARQLMKRGFPLEQDVCPQLHHTVLHHAAEKGNLAVVAFLLEEGGMSPHVQATSKIPSEQENKPYALDIAALHGRIKVIRLLLEKGANPNKGFALFQAIQKARSAEIDIQGQSCLFSKIEIFEKLSIRSARVVEVLLKGGASPNASCRFENPVACQAMEHGLTQVLEVLHAHGVDWGLRDINGKTSLENQRPDRQTLVASWRARLLAESLEPIKATSKAVKARM